MKSALEILLESPNVENRAEKKLKIKRIVLNGEPLVCTIRSLGYARVADVKKMDSDQVPLHMILAGVTDPDFKNKELNEKYGAATPADLVKKLFLPGEIDDICREIEKLSGYRQNMVEEVKKK